MLLTDLIAALCSWPLAYYYTAYILTGPSVGSQGIRSIAWLIFAGLFFAAVELFSRAYGRKPAKESFFWAACWLLQSAAILLYGFHGDPMLAWQVLIWHLTAVYYVLSRTGVLASGRTSCLIFLDGLAGLFTLPWKNILLRLKSLFRWGSHRAQARNRKTHVSAAIVISVLVTICISLFAWAQLSAADANFAGIAGSLSGLLQNWMQKLNADTVIRLILSIPVGAWLFGLVAGSLKRNGTAPITEKQFAEGTVGARRVPPMAAAIPMVTLCAIYLLFFATQACEFLGKTGISSMGHAVMTAPTASAFAVKGFWELCRILLLNLIVLVFCSFFSNGGLAKNPRLRLSAALLTFFGSAFAVLDMAKLYMYVHLYGYTMKRIVSGGFLILLLLFTVLALLRIFFRFRAVPIAIFVSAACFTLLCVTNVEQCINAGNIARYRAGTDRTLDSGVLEECGIDDSRMGLRNTEALVSSGWCKGRELWTLIPLWKYAEWTDASGKPAEFASDQYSSRNGSVLLRTTIRGSILTLKFTDGFCTDAEMMPVSRP